MKDFGIVPETSATIIKMTGNQERESAPSLSGASYVTTLISNSGCATPIEADSDSDYEIICISPSSADSSLGTSISSIHTSLKSFTKHYPFENGRRYHAYNAGSYPFPNDECEQDRMDLCHHVWRLVLDGELVSEVVKEGLASKRGGVQRILDIGTGTGVWAIDFADECVEGGLVIGCDLSPIQPRWVPPNCTFVVDDFSTPWQYTSSESFDFIHARNLAGSVSSWPTLFGEMAKHLQPGGWVEVQECEAEIFSDSDVGMEKAPMLKKWMSLIKSASVLFEKDLDVVGKLEEGLRGAGFEGVGRDIYEIPIGTWTRDAFLDEVGLLNRSSVVDAIEPYTLALFTRVLKWSLLDTKALVEQVKWELKNVELRLYCRFHFVYGRKPDVA